MRTLVLLRHAKSDYPAGVADHDRPLATRGVRDAPVAGAWIRDHLDGVDLALVSSATRARETWALAAPAIGDSIDMRIEGRIYDASASELIEVIEEVPDECTTLVMVGHNPGLEQLAVMLTGHDAQLSALSRKFPTSAIAVIGIEGAWSGVSRGGRLQDFAVPRG